MSLVTFHIFTAALALVVAIACFVHTPDGDRKFAFPDDPDAWFGVDGRPSAPWPALRTTLFWAIFIAVYGVATAILMFLWPKNPALNGLGGAGFGLGFALITAQRMLRSGAGAMQVRPRLPPHPREDKRPRVLFICGSPNQTTQMHKIAKELPDVDAWFTPYFSDHWAVVLGKRFGFLETAILGSKRRRICLDYLVQNGLQIDLDAERNDYDLFFSCNDQVVPPILDGVPMILVQEGIQDPPNWKTKLWKATRLVPRPLTGTSTFGLSGAYEKVCVASEGYRDNYIDSGVDPSRIEVTGIPNFDDFARFLDNDFPRSGFVLVCTTDARETMAEGDRDAFLAEVKDIAGDKPLLFKLHPNENFERATREIHEVFPHAEVYTSGSAEQMVAKCDVLVTEWSSLTFAGVAMGKQVHSHHPMEEIRRLLPLQNKCAAKNIARVFRAVLAAQPTAYALDVTSSSTQIEAIES